MAMLSSLLLNVWRKFWEATPHLKCSIASGSFEVTKVFLRG